MPITRRPFGDSPLPLLKRPTPKSDGDEVSAAEAASNALKPETDAHPQSVSPTEKSPVVEQAQTETHGDPDAAGIKQRSTKIGPNAVSKHWLEPTTKADRQEMFLPVSGFVWFYPEEIAVINHPAFQRLGRIYQLGQAHLVFRGATHKRIEHVLGAVYIAQRMIAAIQLNASKSPIGRMGASQGLSSQEQRFIRLGALLHDIGHVAAGHTLEDELEIIGKHDADERLDLVFNEYDWNRGFNRGIPTLKALVDAHYARYLPKELAQAGVTPTDVVRLLIRKEPGGDQQGEKSNSLSPKDRYAEHKKKLLESKVLRFHVCANMIGNTICADLLDYLYRDWFHCGKPRFFDDRIFQYMEIRRSRASGQNQIEPLPPSSDDRFVIALGQKTKIRTDGVSAILGLLEWRYELAETVLFHRTKLAAGAMLDRALYELWSEPEDDRDAAKAAKKRLVLARKLLPLSDEQLLDEAIIEAEAAARESGEPRFLAAVGILHKLRDRTLFKDLGTFDATNMTSAGMSDARAAYTGLAGSRLADQTKRGASCRAETARLLEYDFFLPVGSVAIYCADIKPKIAEVTIAVDGDVMPFNKYEEKRKKRLSGGHLDAQVERFERLWRICFFVDADEMRRLPRERSLLLHQTIEQLVLANVDAEILNQRAKEKAMALLHQETASGNKNLKFVDDPAIAAAWRDPKVTQARKRYPNGAPSVRSFLSEVDDGIKTTDRGNM